MMKAALPLLSRKQREHSPELGGRVLAKSEMIPLWGREGLQPGRVPRKGRGFQIKRAERGRMRVEALEYISVDYRLKSLWDSFSPAR